MNILFITATRIGDAVLSTGLLSYIERTWPEAKVTIICGPLCVSLFEAYPNVQDIIPLKKKKYHLHWLALWARLVTRRWDRVIDLRNSAVSRLIHAQHRHIFGPHINSNLHKVVQNAHVMRLNTVPDPKLWFTRVQQETAAHLIAKDHRRILAVAPAANWRAKTWPIENFIRIVQLMIDKGGLMPDARVAVFAAAGEEHIAQQLLETIPTGQRIDMIAKADPASVAAALSQTDFFIGNDSGLMHCAAACGVPTLGLFGPSWPHLYRPWGDNGHYIQTPQNFDQLINYPDYHPSAAPCLMTSLDVDSVMKKIQEIMEGD
jgi:ADP-heptose:LPS heptosyltransferase